MFNKEIFEKFDLLPMSYSKLNSFANYPCQFIINKIYKVDTGSNPAMRTGQLVEEMLNEKLKGSDISEDSELFVEIYKNKLKKEFNDGSCNDKDVNVHQLESYGLQYHEKAKTLNQNSSEAEIFNVMGQLQSLQRIKKSGELESSYKEREQLEQHGKPKV